VNKREIGLGRQQGATHCEPKSRRSPSFRSSVDGSGAVATGSTRTRKDSRNRVWPMGYSSWAAAFLVPKKKQEKSVNPRTPLSSLWRGGNLVSFLIALANNKRTRPYHSRTRNETADEVGVSVS